MRIKKYFYDSTNAEKEWGAHEASALIEVFENHNYLFGVMSSDDDVWILMASALQRKGIQVSSRHVAKKWSRMSETFQKLMQSQSVGDVQKLYKQIDRWEDIARLGRQPLAIEPCEIKSLCQQDFSSKLRNFDDSYENLKNMYVMSKRSFAY